MNFVNTLPDRAPNGEELSPPPNIPPMPSPWSSCMRTIRTSINALTMKRDRISIPASAISQPLYGYDARERSGLARRAAAQQAVDAINSGRADLYRLAAARNGVSVAAAGAAAYEQVVSSRLRPGEYYQAADGSWRRK